MKKILIILYFYLFTLAFLNIPTAAQSISVNEESSAVVVMYHRFGEDTFPSTNIKINQFENHISYLINNNFNVLPLEDIASAISRGEKLPDKTVGITIDDAYQSVYYEAWPRLKKANFPFTLFVNTNAIDNNYSRMMTWEQINEMYEAGVSIGNHSASHGHLTKKDVAEWKKEISLAQSRLYEKLGVTPTLFAYPYGEATNEMSSYLRTKGYIAAFGQHSGVASEWLDRYYLPRFSLNEKYGDIARFSLAVNSLPMPAKEISPRNYVLTNNPPIFGFTVLSDSVNVDKIQCFASSQDSPGEIQILNKKRIEVRFKKPFDSSRGRINCTVPSENNRWRWLGMQYLVSQ